MGLFKFTKPADKTKEVIQATLRLYVTAADDKSRETDVKVYSTGESDWDATKVVYFAADPGKDSIYTADSADATLAGTDSAIGALGDQLGDTVTVAAGDNGKDKWIEFDVTDYVKAYGADYSFAVIADTRTAGGIMLASSETANKPQLVILYGNNNSTATAPKAKQTITVTPPGEGTLSVSPAKNVREGDTVTITTTVPDGKKAVPTVKKTAGNDPVDITPDREDPNKFTFTMVGEAVTVAMTTARADAASIEITGPDQIQKGQTGTYTAKVLDTAGTELSDATVTWSVSDNQDSSGTKFESNTLTISGTETAESVTVTATTQKDMTVDAGDSNKITRTKTVTVSTEAVYTIESLPATHGSFTVEVGGHETTNATASDTITVKTTPDAGYQVASVKYGANGTESDATTGEANKSYTITGISSNIKIGVTFELAPLAITNGSDAAGMDTNHGKITKFKAGETDSATTAKAGETVEVYTEAAAGYRVTGVTVEKAAGGALEPPVTATVKEGTTYQFTMPTEPVKVSATFEEIPYEVYVRYVTDTESAEATTLCTKKYVPTEKLTAGANQITFGEDFNIKVNGKPDGNKKFKRYKVEDATKVTSEQTVTISSETTYYDVKVVEDTEDTKEYYYFNDFSQYSNSANMETDGLELPMNVGWSKSGTNHSDSDIHRILATVDSHSKVYNAYLVGKNYNNNGVSIESTETGTVEKIIPYEDGTITYDDGEAKVFDALGRFKNSIAGPDAQNTTKYELLEVDGGTGRGQYVPYDGNALTGNDVKVTFDVKMQRVSYINILGKKFADGNDANKDPSSDQTNLIASIGTKNEISGSNSGKLGIVEGATTFKELADQDIVNNWYHVDAAIDTTTQKVTLKIYKYKANNNYAEETPVYNNTIDFLDKSNSTGVVGLSYYSPSGRVSIDNIYMYGSSAADIKRVKVIAPDAADGTLSADKEVVKKGEEVNITVAAANGKKLTALKVNDKTKDEDENLSEETPNTAYKYTAPDPAVDITIKAEFARADVKAEGGVTVSGDEYVQIGKTATYTAKVVDDADHELTGDDAKVTWSLENGTANVKADGTSISADGELTVAADQPTGTIKVVAKVKKDVTSEDSTDANMVKGEITVNVTQDQVFKVTKEPAQNGSFICQVDSGDSPIVTDKQTLTIIPTGSEGYEVDKVYWRYANQEAGSNQEITYSEGYKLVGSGLTGNVVITVTFKLSDYKITVTAENSAKLKFRVDGEEGTSGTTPVHMGQTVTVIPAAASGQKVTSITLEDDGEKNPTATGNSFIMPAANVTITAATLDESFTDGSFGSLDFDSATQVSDIGTVASGNGGIRYGTPTIETADVSDKFLKAAIKSDEAQRSKDFITLTSPIDFTASDNAKITFDMMFNAQTTDSHESFADFALTNSDDKVLFSMKVGTSDALKAGVYAGGLVNKTTTGTFDTVSAWGKNEFLAKDGVPSPLTKDDAELTVKADTWYNVELSLKDNKMTVSVNEKGQEDKYTAELDISGLKKDINAFTILNEHDKDKKGAGTYGAINNIVVKESWAE